MRTVACHTFFREDGSSAESPSKVRWQVNFPQECVTERSKSRRIVHVKHMSVREIWNQGGNAE